jgi:NAD(P)H dehydrogenase (quinone)
MSIVITGASGSFGRLVTARLLEKVPASELVMITRNPAGLKDLQTMGAQIRHGDFDQQPSLRTAFEGAEKLLLISTLSVGRRVGQHRNAIEAAVAAGVRHIVYTSSVGIHPRNPAIVIPDHLATEEMLRRCGVAWTFLRGAQYAEAIATMLAPRAVATGRWVTSAGDGCMAFVARDDCAASAAAVLTTPGHEGAAYEITGPELLSLRDCARIASEISRRPIDYAVVSPVEMQRILNAAGVPDEYREGLSNVGLGARAANELVSWEQGIRAGYFALCSRHVELLTGRPARSLREVMVANRTALVPAGD